MNDVKNNARIFFDLSVFIRHEEWVTQQSKYTNYYFL